MFGLCASKREEPWGQHNSHSVHTLCNCGLQTWHQSVCTTLSATRLVAQTCQQFNKQIIEPTFIVGQCKVDLWYDLQCACIVQVIGSRLCVFTGTISCLTQPLPPGLLAVQISHQLSKPTFMLACVEWFYNVIFSVHVLCNMVKHSSLEECVTCHDEPRINCMLGQH